MGKRPGDDLDSELEDLIRTAVQDVKDGPLRWPDAPKGPDDETNC